MKLLTSIFLLLCISQSVETAELREAYKTAAASEENASVFIKLTEHIDSTAVQQAYLGAAFALKAKFGGDKIQNMREAKDLLEAAVAREPNNIEIRMIRLSIQESLPAIAGYGQAIDSDTDFIAENLGNVEEEDLKKYLKGFISHSKSFTAEEKTRLLQL